MSQYHLPFANSKTPSGLEVFKRWMDYECTSSLTAPTPEGSSGYADIWSSWLTHLYSRYPRVPVSEGGVMAWQDATPLDVYEFLRPRHGQVAKHQPNRQLSEVTRRRYWRVLERVYGYALDNAWIDINPATEMEPGDRPLPDYGEGNCLPTTIWEQLPKHFPKPTGYQDARDNAIAHLLYYLALASEEVRTLTWSNVLSAPETVWRPEDGDTPKSLVVGGFRNAQARELPIPPCVATALKEWCMQCRMHAGELSTEPEQLIFISKRGRQPMTIRTLFHVASQIIQRAHAAMPEDQQKAPLVRVGPQVLRNTAIVQRLSAGEPLSEVVLFAGLSGPTALRRLRPFVQD